jgi:hypothetical protein
MWCFPIGQRHARHAVLLALCLSGLTLSCAAQNLLDPVFSTVPFESWLAGPDHTQIPFKSDAAEPRLDYFQRLRLFMNIVIDGKELAKRPAAGKLMMFVQFTDIDRRIYQTHGEFDLRGVNASAKQANFVYSPGVLLTPGDYLVTIAVFDTQTGEHSLMRKTMRVPPLKEDPLPQSWRGMPPVEFLNEMRPPDAWFLPDIKGRLHLPLETRSPVRIELLTILPSDQTSARIENRLMFDLVSSLKDLSQIDVRNGSLSSAVLDLTRRRVAYEQPLTPTRPLNWPALSEALTDANPGTIDVQSLENRTQSVDFFLKEMGRRIQRGAAASPRHILVIVSGPMTFASGTDIHQIALDENPGVEVYYLRHEVPPDRRAMPVMPSRRGPPRGIPGGNRGRDPGRIPRGEAPDSLEGTLKPLKPHLFEVRNPEEFRKALAAMLEEIARR